MLSLYSAFFLFSAAIDRTCILDECNAAVRGFPYTERSYRRRARVMREPFLFSHHIFTYLSRVVLHFTKERMMVNSVGNGGSGCQGSSGTQGGTGTNRGDDSKDLEDLWDKLIKGEDLSDDEKKKLKKALMDKGHSEKDADSIINNQGKSPSGETPEDIK
jgi:hypothetical protein